MILAIVSVIIGFILLVYQFPLTELSLNLISLLSLSLLLIFFGVWLFYSEWQHSLKTRKQRIQWQHSILKQEFVDYPSLDLMCHRQVLQQVVWLINKKRMQHANSILLQELYIKKKHSQFALFAWLLNEHDDRVRYRCYARMFKMVHRASFEVLKILLHPNDVIIELINTNITGIQQGFYLLRSHSDIELIALPFHVRSIQDDFYGHLIYDAKLDHPNYIWHRKDIQSSKARVKQSNHFLFNGSHQIIKKPTTQTVYEYHWIISNDHHITFYSEQLSEW
jgi:hypothetical protein